MRFVEFISLVALLISLVALSVDSVLPALPQLGETLGALRSNDPQLVVTSLLLGLGLGQLLCGPLSDSIGRRPVILGGIAIFVMGCLLSIVAVDFNTMLLGRFLQGVGASAPRIVTVALVRDLYQGRAMARVMSFAMSIFILVPAVAPALGQLVLSLFASWRAIFWLSLALSVVAGVWFAVRQVETLAPEQRRPLSWRALCHALVFIMSNTAVMAFTIATGLIFSPFVAYLSAAQQIFQDTYGAGLWFSLYFAIAALAIGFASLINARLVMRYGMRRLSMIAAGMLALISSLFLLVTWMADGVPYFGWFLSYIVAAFVCIGLLFGNLNALAMEPLGDMAGLGAAVVGFLSTVISVPLGAVIAYYYDGTVYSLVAGFAGFAAATYGVIRWANRHCPEPT